MPATTRRPHVQGVLQLPPGLEISKRDDAVSQKKLKDLSQRHPSVQPKHEISRRLYRWRTDWMKLPVAEVWRAVNDCLPKDKRIRSPNTIDNYEARNNPSVKFLVALKEA